MKLSKGKIYTIDNSDIVVKVLNIVYTDDTIIKAKCVIAHKSDGMIYEVKYLRLNKERISHWEVFNE